jgi:hypothetical protein
MTKLRDKTRVRRRKRIRERKREVKGLRLMLSDAAVNNIQQMTIL